MHGMGVYFTGEAKPAKKQKLKRRLVLLVEVVHQFHDFPLIVRPSVFFGASQSGRFTFFKSHSHS